MVGKYHPDIVIALSLQEALTLYLKNVNLHYATLYLISLDLFVFAAVDMDGGSAEGTFRGGVLRLGGLCAGTDQTISAAASCHTGGHAQCH